jgi:DMSO/TMAO reductase YedYZ molybdopterin-dependent catalytic subunit
MTRVIFYDIANTSGTKLKKTYTGIATTIVTLLILTSFAYNLIPSAKSATADSEAEWQLNVTGLVENPMNLTWAEIFALPTTTVNAVLICVDFSDNPVAQGNWTGIKLRTLLEEVRPSATAIKVGFYAADGYSTDLPVETAMRDDVILAYEKNGESLNDMRLVVPGKWGYKWISQLTRIELLNYNFLGFWESQGYSDDANISSRGTQSAQENPSRLNIYPYNPGTSPSTSSSPPPSQPPNTSPAPSDQPTPTPETSENRAIPTEAIYAIAASLVAVVLVAVLTSVRKRTNEKN